MLCQQNNSRASGLVEGVSRWTGDRWTGARAQTRRPGAWVDAGGGEMFLGTATGTRVRVVPVHGGVACIGLDRTQAVAFFILLHHQLDDALGGKHLSTCVSLL